MKVPKINNQAFTLMEIVIVVILLGIIAGFAIPNYSKAIRKAHERDAINQLISLSAANLIYNARQGKFVDDDGSPGDDLTYINTNLGINIIPNELIYSYDQTSNTAYTAKAIWNPPGTADDFTLCVNQGAITTGTNPCCNTSTNTCPSLADCAFVPCN